MGHRHGALEPEYLNVFKGYEMIRIHNEYTHVPYIQNQTPRMMMVWWWYDCISMWCDVVWRDVVWRDVMYASFKDNRSATPLSSMYLILPLELSSTAVEFLNSCELPVRFPVFTRRNSGGSGRKRLGGIWPGLLCKISRNGSGRRLRHSWVGYEDLIIKLLVVWKG